MRIDVSEVKAFNTCGRQWMLSSRNMYHLRPRVTPQQFSLGTLFHEALAELYLDVPLDTVMDKVKAKMSCDNDAALLAMIPGYAKEVLPGDLERYKVLDIEWHFDFVPTRDPYPYGYEDDYPWETGEIEYPFHVCGSIDMIVLDVDENAVYGFEHKTAKNFRGEEYLWLDEQPRVYSEALSRYVTEYNARNAEKLRVGELDTFEPATFGGVYLNEVKKLLRQFQYRRTLCTYDPEDHDNFMISFYNKCNEVRDRAEFSTQEAPKPGYMSCSMCTYKTVCATYMYRQINKEAVLNEFAEEFVEREEDHLAEKVEQSGETGT